MYKEETQWTHITDVHPGNIHTTIIAGAMSNIHKLVLQKYIKKPHCDQTDQKLIAILQRLNYLSHINTTNQKTSVIINSRSKFACILLNLDDFQFA